MQEMLLGMRIKLWVMLQVQKIEIRELINLLIELNSSPTLQNRMPQFQDKTNNQHKTLLNHHKLLQLLHNKLLNKPP